MKNDPIKVGDARLNSIVYYKSGHGTTWAGVMKSIALAIENPSNEVIYEDADSSYSTLLDIFKTILDTNPTLKSRFAVAEFVGGRANSVILKYQS